MKTLFPRRPRPEFRRAVSAMAVMLCLAGPAPAQSTGAKQAALTDALDAAMTPGAGQQRLQSMVGNFNVKISTWIDPSKPPVESTGSSVNKWVLGNRYVQIMLSAGDKDSSINGIGYVAYDNVAKFYQAAWMDDGSTGMTWYRGQLDASGKSAVMKATTSNPVTGKPSPLEMRMTITPDGTHATELWGTGLGTTKFKMMELRYTPVGK